MGTLGVIRGRLYEVWEVYGTLVTSILLYGETRTQFGQKGLHLVTYSKNVVTAKDR